MNKVFVVILGLLAALNLSRAVWAGEHGGKEHGGQASSIHEHGGTSQVKTPGDEDIRSAMKSYVATESEKTGGNFEVFDPDTNKTRKLQMLRVHERVGKTGNYYYSCADFKDVDSGELLDLDLDVEDRNGKLQVADVRVHKVGGKERYTYDAHDNRVPLTEAENQEHGGR